MGLGDWLFLHAVEVAFILLLCLMPYFMLTLSAVLYLVTVGVAYLGLRVTRQKLSRKIQVDGKGVLITGCDTGFGHDLARRLDERGFTVFAGCLNANSEGAKKLKRNSSKRLHVVDMDVTRDESVARAHDYVLANLPPQGLWAIVNNAGLNVMGDVEWCTVNLYQKAMDVNFYGAVRTIRTFLHLVRETKGNWENAPFPTNMADRFHHHQNDRLRHVSSGSDREGQIRNNEDRYTVAMSVL